MHTEQEPLCLSCVVAVQDVLWVSYAYEADTETPCIVCKRSQRNTRAPVRWYDIGGELTSFVPTGAYND